MDDASSPRPKLPTLPSVDVAMPLDEGGSLARSGFDYQDEIAVGILIEMLRDPTILTVHCETHDDLLLVRDSDTSGPRYAEFVQVKSGAPDKLWSVADLCERKAGAPGTSVLERSLMRDQYCESARFRLVTLRPVVDELKVLTFGIGEAGREADGARIVALRSQIDKRVGQPISPKGNGVAYWLEHCTWKEGHTEVAVHNANVLSLMEHSRTQGRPLLEEHAQVLMEDLKAWAASAGRARWEPDRAKKIISSAELWSWWDRRLSELIDGTTSPAGGRLRSKLVAAELPDDMVDMAQALRREYSAAVRTSRYMEADEAELLQARVMAEVMSLRSRFVAGQSVKDGVSFHALCLETMAALDAERPTGRINRSAFLKGCLYDIADRCLLRFAGPAQ